MSVPWSYNAPRDTRTLFDLARIEYRRAEASDLEHHALADAVAQARAVIRAYAKLGIKG